jgi:hypothetical protein
MLLGKHRFEIVHGLVLAASLMLGCGSSSGEPADPDAGSRPDAAASCAPGEKECRADGLYTCDSNLAFERTETCARCEVDPEPHCQDRCAEPGVTFVCAGDAMVDCATGETRSCAPGTCVAAGQELVCATRPGVSTCQGRQADGTEYVLACADESGVSSDQVCDLRTGECAAAEFDCAELAEVAEGEVICDASGNYYTSCAGGQPRALLCGADTTCAGDGSFNCYSAPEDGAACGGPTVCAPGLHCTQDDETGASCVLPFGVLECTDTDVLAVCADEDTAFACVDGAVWRWNNLTSWGGTCIDNEVVLASGGQCIPGLADCEQGLECHRSLFEIAGTCRAPEADAPAECTLTGMASTGLSCVYEWHACRDGNHYGVSCRTLNVAGQIITVCDCLVNGEETQSFTGNTICNVMTVEELDVEATASCGWPVSTIETARAL